MKFAVLFIVSFLLFACFGSDFHRTVVIPELKVHIVGSSDLLPCGTFGCCSKGEIWVVGYRGSDGRIWAPDMVLGHELRHLLERYDGDIIGPWW